MHRIAVDSSNIVSIGHDSETLEVEFKSGGVYSYTPVSTELYQRFLSAESKGKFFWKYIRNTIPYERIYDAERVAYDTF